MEGHLATGCCVLCSIQVCLLTKEKMGGIELFMVNITISLHISAVVSSGVKSAMLGKCYNY